MWSMITSMHSMRCLSVFLIFTFFGAPVSSFAAGTPQLTVQVVARPSGSVPIGAQRVTMLTVRLAAACTGDVKLYSILFHHHGLGNASDLERVYGMIDGKRITRAVLVSGRERTAKLVFRNFMIRSCTTASIDIHADFSADATATGQHGLKIVSSEDIETDPPSRIFLNPAGVQSITIPVGTPKGTVSAELLHLLNTLTYGSARTVARIRLRADTREDQAITAITFVNDGTARDDDLQNFILETSGHTRLSATVPSLDGDRIRVVLDPPLVLRRNEVRLIQLLGDIRASRRKTVRFIIQEPSDIEAAPVR